MNKEIFDFLTNNRVCSLTTLLSDGMPHAAALHFSHSEQPFELYFSTENTSRKCQALRDGQVSNGAVVVGLSEEEWKTLQMDGEVRIVSGDELAAAQEIHYVKHPNSAKYKDEPETVFLKFTPTWWRYTDYKTDPITIISSEN